MKKRHAAVEEAYAAQARHPARWSRSPSLHSASCL